MVRLSRIVCLVVCLALTGLLAAGCAGDAATTSLDVAETGFPVPTTTATTTAAVTTTTTTAAASVLPGLCAEPPDPTIVPADADRRCDAAAGWRMSAWIGGSGDGIIYLEQRVGDEWISVTFGPYCGGVAAITEPDLLGLGVPADLARAWSVRDSMCAADQWPAADGDARAA